MGRRVVLDGRAVMTGGRNGAGILDATRVGEACEELSAGDVKVGPAAPTKRREDITLAEVSR
ncbi:hypothetical protein Acy02nite_49210 [Actinoplanes cyaneus]|uniref:Uncharacterized protein n=1 Tax=Actinoplanes cyaneus TaxID=52696 RepID=A0A919M2A5_9ACTN|nr:hypothetical protein Acy02nite_49210 [Actinoplanes cyaneus]